MHLIKPSPSIAFDQFGSPIGFDEVSLGLPISDRGIVFFNSNPEDFDDDEFATLEFVSTGILSYLLILNFINGINIFLSFFKK